MSSRYLWRAVAGLSLLSCNASAVDVSKLPDVERAVATFTPRPEYPYEARAQQLTGTGIAVFEVDSPTGRVKRVFMAISTGAKILDDAAIDAFSRWRFKPGAPPFIKTPISFTLADGRGGTNYYASSRSMDDVLASFLGKGTVVKGPIPAYPRSPKWTHKTGKGVYELHAGSDGRVQRVRVVKSSGDEVFDREAVKTLGAWRLRRGPLILELPLRFRLTPNHYSVDVAR